MFDIALYMTLFTPPSLHSFVAFTTYHLLFWHESHHSKTFKSTIIFFKLHFLTKALFLFCVALHAPVTSSPSFIAFAIHPHRLICSASTIWPLLCISELLLIMYSVAVNRSSLEHTICLAVGLLLRQTLACL